MSETCIGQLSDSSDDELTLMHRIHHQQTFSFINSLGPKLNKQRSSMPEQVK